MKPLTFLPLLLTGCASAGLLEVTPNDLDWGEIDFHTDECMDCLCADGCGPTQLVLTNAGEGPLSLTMPKGFDSDHLCINGYTSEPNFNLGTLQPDEFFLLEVAICGYLPGELNLPGEDPARSVTGALHFTTDGEPSELNIPFSFIPVRNQD